LTGLVAVFVNVNVVALGPDFLRLWVGSAFAETAFPILIALGIAGIAHGIGVQSQTPCCLALGRVRFAALVLAAEGLTNLVLSVTLAPRLGITGVAVATAIPAVAIGGCVIPIYVSRLVGTTVNDLLSRAVSPVMIFLVALTATHALLWVALPGGTFVALAGKFCVGAATAGAIGWSVSSDSERRLVRATLESRRRSLRSRQIGEPASRGVLK
jgi:O-antigen/teichoic acid export membrane protein